MQDEEFKVTFGFHKCICIRTTFCRILSTFVFHCVLGYNDGTYVLAPFKISKLFNQDKFEMLTGIERSIGG